MKRLKGGRGIANRARSHSMGMLGLHVMMTSALKMCFVAGEYGRNEEQHVAQSSLAVDLSFGTETKRGETCRFGGAFLADCMASMPAKIST